VAIWGRRVGLHQPIRDGDRVELCRALTVDPKQARRLRYKAQRKEKRPAGAGR
jgi:putative ubiquitin-RnfH superfamily antitoxin RatB of RatAB toxin-antitoxin module